VNFSKPKQKYVILGVTGPNEYENNVNNNWYTNTIACWCLKYTIHSLDELRNSNPAAYGAIISKTGLNESEVDHWNEIVENMYYPYDPDLNIFLQQDGFLDKEIKSASEIPDDQIPIWQNWSWDRILRSCFIKQADVLQGMYFFEEDYDLETIKRHFEYYEDKTVHESSLSPCVHAILASKTRYYQKAYELYLRTSRLDLDDYNNDTEDGCHITSMAGTWMSLVKGFGGMRVKEDRLAFYPFLPEKWEAYRFTVKFRGSTIEISVKQDVISIDNKSGKEIELIFFDEKFSLSATSRMNLSWPSLSN
jgi:maltose phosphorylase